MTNQNLLNSNYPEKLKTKMPEIEHVFFNLCFDKNQLKNLLSWFLEKYGQKTTVDFLELLKKVGFHQATRAGVSLGLDDLQIPVQKSAEISQARVKIGELTSASNTGNITSVEKSQRVIDTWNQTSEILRQKAVQNFRVTNPVNPVFMMAFSGARGNISQVRQLVAMRGLMADPQGAILEFPIQSNFREGLTITEYLISCYGARKGLVDTALRTATSGYLTRRLVDAVQHVVVLIADCKTTRGLFLNHINLEHRVLGRVLLKDFIVNSRTVIEKNTLISPNLAKIISLNTQGVYVRSPLTCDTEKSVCQCCYGLNLAQGKLVSIGEAVGVIAAQSIGEPGTQLTMRTFHTGGVGVFSQNSRKSFRAPFDGKVHFLENLPGLFVRTPHGDIVYVIKSTPNQENKPVLRLDSTASPKEIYEIWQTDIPPGSLLWVKQGEYVKFGQLVLEASQIQTSTHQMPESSHPVTAPFSGEVFFESMVIRVIQKFIEVKGKAPEEDISPKFRTLTQLGNFWVFSTGIQQEYKYGFSEKIDGGFFFRGDVLSLDTPLVQYNLYCPKRGQLKFLNSIPVLTQTFFDLFVSKSVYSKLFYFLVTPNQRSLIVYSNDQKNPLFTWYPALTNLRFFSSGYCLVLPNTYEKSGLLDDLEKDKITQKNSKPRFFWSEQKVLGFNQLQSLIQNSCFLVTNSCLTASKTGFFQVEITQKIKWVQKIVFPVEISKNSFKSQQIYLSQFILKNSRCEIPEKNLIQKKQGWFCILEHHSQSVVELKLPSSLLEPGTKIETISFENSAVSLNFINMDSVVFLKSKTKKTRLNFPYSIKNLLKSNLHPTKQSFSKIEIENPFSDQNWSNEIKSLIFKKEFSQHFSYYKLNRQRINTETNLEFLVDLNSFTFKIKTKRHIENLLFIQKNSQQFIPNIEFFKQQWKLRTQDFLITSPIYNKQKATSFQKSVSPRLDFKLVLPSVSEWFVLKNFLKIEISPKPNLVHTTTSKFRLELSKSTDFFIGFSFFCYDFLKFQNSNQFVLKSFQDDWVLPEFPITQAFLKSTNAGEFRVSKQPRSEMPSRRWRPTRNDYKIPYQRFFSVLRSNDLRIFTLPTTRQKLQKLPHGGRVRWGEELLPNYGVPISGQILKITSSSLTIQQGMPLLASARGVIHVCQADLIQKNDLLITLKSRRLQTEDIVQGIPKIEQLFEARETQGGEIIANSAKIQLQGFFKTALQFQSFKTAVNSSVHQIQIFLVEKILEAYSNQGVTLSEKHVEIVVRQMTSRVRILSGGDTGLLAGEFVQLKWMEQINSKLDEKGYRQARYEPLLLGITKSVLQSESFLVAASFQEVSRVLIRSALSKKIDFLRGLHENVILGQLLPAGTGAISRTRSKKN